MISRRAYETTASVTLENFASLLLTISFGFAMINYYATPIPGIGTDFHHLITDQAQSLSTTLSQNMIDTIVKTAMLDQTLFEGLVQAYRTHDTGKPAITDALGTEQITMPATANTVWQVMQRTTPPKAA